MTALVAGILEGPRAVQGRPGGRSNPRLGGRRAGRYTAGTGRASAGAQIAFCAAARMPDDFQSSRSAAGGNRRLRVLLLAGVLLAGCTPARRGVATDAEQLAEYIELVLPARIQVLEWTKPVSLTGSGDADGLEVILAAYDAFDDETKAIGTFHFELQSWRPSEHLGTRVAFWTVDVTTARALRSYRDHPTGFYRFPLQLVRRPLTPGTYILTVRLHLPTGRRLEDEHRFDYDGSPVPTVRPL